MACVAAAAALEALSLQYNQEKRLKHLVPLFIITILAELLLLLLLLHSLLLLLLDFSGPQFAL